MPPEIYRRALREGWTDLGGKGSHRKMVKNGKMVPIPFHRKELPKGTWEKIRRDFGWEK